jgi:DNA-binding NarL/FixJ family response regulator
MNAGVVKTYGNLSERNRTGIKPVSITVSIVEDYAPVRGILTEWIRGVDGFKCVGVHANAEAALCALPQEKPSVVLMDINLPGMSGIECVRRLKPQMLDTQFIMLTVYDDSDQVFKALSSGATGYMLKRTPRAELLTAIKDVHAGGSPISCSIARKIVQSFQRFSGNTAAEPDNLSPREREVLELVARGYHSREIAESLHVGLTTVNTHIRRIFKKLHVCSRSQAIAKFTHIPNAAVAE